MNGASAIPWANTMGYYHELLPCATVTSYYIVVVVVVVVVVAVVVVVESTCVCLICPVTNTEPTCEGTSLGAGLRPTCSRYSSSNSSSRVDMCLPRQARRCSWPRSPMCPVTDTEPTCEGTSLGAGLRPTCSRYEGGNTLLSFVRSARAAHP